MMRHQLSRSAVVLAAAAAVAVLVAPAQLRGQDQFRFHTGVELINVTATVTDSDGRFASGLTKADFIVYDDDQLVEITHFSAERVPVSLGIVLDTSGSMGGEKITAARSALERFLFDLLGPDDEFFLYRFDNAPHKVTGWTTDRSRVSGELATIRPDGATALYDAVAQALPLLQSGRHAKKALLVISDGNDTSSRTELRRLEDLIRESDALVYAIGIDAQPTPKASGGVVPGTLLALAGGATRARDQRGRPMPMPFPGAGRGRPPQNPPVPGLPPVAGPPRAPRPADPEEPSSRGVKPETPRVDALALHEMTDGSGGRTEIIRDTGDLGPTTTRIADELRNQYYLGYPSRGRQDARWHTIRVEVRDKSFRVRARKGYIG